MYSIRWPAQATHRIAHSPASESSSLASWPAQRVGCMCAYYCLLVRQVQYSTRLCPVYYVWILACASRRRPWPAIPLVSHHYPRYYVSCSRNTTLALNLLILPLAVGRMGGCRALVGYVCYVWCEMLDGWMLDASFLESLDLPCFCLACRDSQP
jgi:hypothetical protein